MDGFIEGGAIGAVQIADDDALVKANRVDQGTTMLTLRVPNSVGGFWNSGRPVYLDLQRRETPNTGPS